jgi:nucleoside-diphosphate-sugar epimerase
MQFEFKNVLVTGAAGFIGFHLAKRLLDDGYVVVGIDNLNPYYDVRLKEARLQELTPYEAFSFHKMELSDKKSLGGLFDQHQFEVVVNLAARMPPSRRQPSGICVVQLCLWSQHQNALFRASQCRSSRLSLCGH